MPSPRRKSFLFDSEKDLTGQRGHRGVRCLALPSLPVRCQIYESIAEWNQAQSDMQWYAMARCVAMVKEMIGQALDYSVCFPKQPACTQQHQQQQQQHTHTQAPTWLSWNKQADCSSFMSKAIWMEMQNGSALPKLIDTPTSCEWEEWFALWTYHVHHSWK